jgi:hypothetical protein
MLLPLLYQSLGRYNMYIYVIAMHSTLSLTRLDGYGKVDCCDTVMIHSLFRPAYCSAAARSMAGSLHLEVSRFFFVSSHFVSNPPDVLTSSLVPTHLQRYPALAKTPTE